MQDKKFVGGPEFNVLGLCRTDLFALVLNIFIRLNIHTTLKMNISQVLDFLIDVAENYTEAPYHSFYHATDIVTMLYYFVSFTTDKLTDLDITFLMVAALCHDIGHVSVFVLLLVAHHCLFTKYLFMYLIAWFK